MMQETSRNQIKIPKDLKQKMAAEEEAPKPAESPKLKNKSDDDPVVKKKKKPFPVADAEKRGRRAKKSSDADSPKTPKTPKTPATGGSSSRRIKIKLDLGEDGTEPVKRIKKKKKNVTADGEESTTEKKARRKKAASRSLSPRKSSKKSSPENPDKHVKMKKARSKSLAPVEKRRRRSSNSTGDSRSDNSDDSMYTKEKGDMPKLISPDHEKTKKKSSDPTLSPKLKKSSKKGYTSNKDVEDSNPLVHIHDGGQNDLDFEKVWEDGSTHNVRQSSAAASSSPSPRPSQAKVSKEAEHKDASTFGERISQLKGENTTLQVKVQDQEDLIITLNEERDKELSKFSKTMSDLLELKAIHIGTKTESEELRIKSGELESTLVNKDEHISDLESTSIEQMDRIRQLGREVGFAKQDIIRMKSGQQNVKDPAYEEKQKTDFEDLCDELAEVQAILAERDGKIGALEKAQVDQMVLMEELEKELDYAKDDLFRLEEEAEKRLIAAEEIAERRLIAAEDAERKLIAAEEAPQKLDSGGLTEKEGQLDEWESDLIDRENQFDEERKAQEQKFVHMLDLADFEKDLADRAKKLESEEAFWDVKEKRLDELSRVLVEKEKSLTDKEMVLDEKQMKLGALTNKLNGEKETVNRKSMQVTPFLASQAALKKQNKRGLGSDDDATIAQLGEEIGKLKEENERVKKDVSTGMIEELKKQHEEAVQKLQEGIDKQLFDTSQTKLEEQILVEEKLREKDASIEFIQREMEELKEELEELLREEAERGQKETQIDAVMEENELLQDQLEEEREESAEQISEMTEAIVRLQETNRELDEKIEAEAVKNKDMVILDLQIEINELNIALEKQNTNEYAAKLRQEVKELKTERNKMKTELQDKEAGAYRHIEARDEAIKMLQKEVDRVYVKLGEPIGTFELDLPAPATPPPQVVEPSGFFGMLMGTS
jgi:hypothetical protein